jgi:hypothetical protein
LAGWNSITRITLICPISERAALRLNPIKSSLRQYFSKKTSLDVGQSFQDKKSPSNSFTSVLHGGEKKGFGRRMVALDWAIPSGERLGYQITNVQGDLSSL